MSAPRIVADLHRKLDAVPGDHDDVMLAVCARDEVRNLPDDVQAVTAADIFAPDPQPP